MRRRSLVAAVAAATIALGALTAPQFASSAPRSNPRAERERVRAEQARVAANIDVKKASLSEVNAALRALDENVATQEAALARVQNEVAQAKQDIADAEAAIGRLSREVSKLRALMRERAVRAFVSPPGDDVLTVLETRDFVSASSRKFFIELRAQSDADVADKLDGAQADLDFQREKAEAAKARAERKEAEQERRTDAVRTARGQQAKVAESVQSSINTQIARSIALAETDRELSAQIAREQALLQARLLAERARQKAAAAQAAREQAARDQAARDQAAANNSGGGGNQAPNGSETRPLPPPVDSGPSGSGTGGISLCTVGGITINCQIEGQVSRMLTAAANDGVTLSGSGYRDPQQQIELRRQHCGSSYYAIYEMPSSSCHPPTAKPGTSQHEIGLAIDFSPCGRGSACFGWLSRRAAEFGFYNLPSESWHWSTSGT